MKTLIEEHITIDVTGFIAENGVTIQAPHGSIADMPSVVSHLVDRYKPQNSPTVYYSNIPEGEYVNTWWRQRKR